MLMRFSVHYYVNGVNKYVISGLNTEEAYSTAIPSLLPFYNGGRWNVLMKESAMEKMYKLLTGETLKVCWQHPPEAGDTDDTRHILIMREAQFSVYYYVNGVNTYVMNGLSTQDAYAAAVPGEALLPFDGGARWHVLMKQPALEQMSYLLTGETLRVCWQHPPERGATGDTEHILIVREADNKNKNLILNENDNKENIIRGDNYRNEINTMNNQIVR